MNTQNQPLRAAFVVITLFAVGSIAVSDSGAQSTSVANSFAYLYPTQTLPRGEHQYEQWITWQTDKESDPQYHRLEFRQEFEHGLSDRLQFAFYLATWRHTRTSEGSKTAVRNSAVELVYTLSDPTESYLGSALYGEVKFDSRLLAVETKLLLEKFAGPWVFGYNGVIEQEWEGENYAERKGEVKNILGASYRLSSLLTVGGEYLWETETEDWSSFEKAVSYLGPNATLGLPQLWVVVTPLFKLTDQNDKPNFQMRTLIGIPF